MLFLAMILMSVPAFQDTVTVQCVRYETVVEMRPVCVQRAVVEQVEVPVCQPCQVCQCKQVTVYRKAWFQRHAQRKAARQARRATKSNYIVTY
jgi:hypothetical protein